MAELTASGARSVPVSTGRSQLILMLESHGTTPVLPITEEDLKSLPAPDEVWG